MQSLAFALLWTIIECEGETYRGGGDGNGVCAPADKNEEEEEEEVVGRGPSNRATERSSVHRARSSSFCRVLACTSVLATWMQGGLMQRVGCASRGGVWM